MVLFFPWCFVCRDVVYKFNFGFGVLFNSEEKGVLDESDRFVTNPIGFASEFARNWSLPSHIVLFDSEEKLPTDFLIAHSFEEVHSEFVVSVTFCISKVFFF